MHWGRTDRCLSNMIHKILIWFILIPTEAIVDTLQGSMVTYTRWACRIYLARVWHILQPWKINAQCDYLYSTAEIWQGNLIIKLPIRQAVCTSQNDRENSIYNSPSNVPSMYDLSALIMSPCQRTVAVACDAWQNAVAVVIFFLHFDVNKPLTNSWIVILDYFIFMHCCFFWSLRVLFAQLDGHSPAT